MSNLDNEKVIRRFVDALHGGDLTTIADTLAEDASWHLHGTLPVAGHYAGRDAVINDFLGQGLGLFADGSLKIELTTIVSDGPIVAIEWHATGQSTNGNPYDNEYALFFRLSDGKITAIREYCDTLHVKDALYG
ncbi:hypothetical protein GCM10017786_59270 [Amycolatopsis deserti]|uniref:SnoaL-like domain-containing protein n=1 Tax=Amycolatopsis deserti TaxID=185696 RepID=A0ABQ3JEV8_9PSEU|nr:nuclear transport factor 2 family protein [Amycolatopsis deserti]GHF17461.1 hypothetical protein GCM10017786_59270 [Amycolatopsis deserti]